MLRRKHRDERATGHHPCSASRTAVAGVVPSPVPVKPVVPWTGDLVRPLLSQLANLLEKIDGETLEREAAKVSPACAAFVRANCSWNPVAKTSVVEGGAECAVKYLNLSGVSAEYAPEIKLTLGVVAILHSRHALLVELRLMREEATAAAKANATAEAKARVN